MIDRQEILDFAAEIGLDPHVVEKDYVLGWILGGIGQHPVIGDTWLFKGGTCLKKCFFETYRFSEDLDFTVPDSAHLTQEALTRIFGEVTEWVYAESGIEMPPDARMFEIYTNPRGKESVQGRLGYRGPLGRQGSIPRIKLDLTDDERVVLEADRREVHHPYSDGTENGFEVLTYRFEEVFAEKTRALYERLRPRDLYDVVHLFRRTDLAPDRTQVMQTLERKCEYKGIPVPTIAALQAHQELPALRNDWEAMLGHQLPALPVFDEFWGELPRVFDWLFGAAAPAVLASAPAMAERAEIDEAWQAPAMATNWRAEGITAPLELIRFAAMNHLCVQLTYESEDGRVSSRTIEPYSLRRTKDGNLLLHAVRHDDGQARSYRVDRIRGATAAKTSFVPRFAIELTASGPISASPSAVRSSSWLSVRAKAKAPRRSTFRGQGPKHVYQCMYCNRKVTRERMDSRLKPHKGKNGWPCPGRTGMYVTTQY